MEAVAINNKDNIVVLRPTAPVTESAEKHVETAEKMPTEGFRGDFGGISALLRWTGWQNA